MAIETVPGSFRDPSGFVFFQDGAIHRQVNERYREDYDHLIHSGLYKNLCKAKLLIPHEEVGNVSTNIDRPYKTIRPEPISFISYPYEWCFSQLKDAALTTLAIQRRSLDFSMSLKDASNYNIQYRKGQPVLIDTLSFEKYSEGEPWVAYRQFCQHFLVPLALMAHVDARVNQLLRTHLGGIPLELGSRLLPYRTYLKPSLLFHIHLHAGIQRRLADSSLKKKTRTRKFSKKSMLGLVDSLSNGVRKLQWAHRGTEWVDYYGDTNYSPEASNHKKEIVAQFLDILQPKVVWDFGGNVGTFSRMAADRGAETISFDMDPGAVEMNYLENVKKNGYDLLPLVQDLTNPSPNLGWESQERISIFDRGPAETGLALALVHHLVVSNNLPLSRIASFFGRICNSLIIEFIPKHDSQIQRLLRRRGYIWHDYTQEDFESEFAKVFTIRDSLQIRESERIIYAMTRKEN